MYSVKKRVCARREASWCDVKGLPLWLCMCRTRQNSVGGDAAQDLKARLRGEEEKGRAAAARSQQLEAELEQARLSVARQDEVFDTACQQAAAEARSLPCRFAVIRLSI